MKKYIFFLIFTFIAPILKAQVSLLQFEIAANYLSSNKLVVNDPSVITDFKFYISLQRAAASTGGYVSGNCTVTLLYTENPNNLTEAFPGGSDYESDPSTIELMTPKNVTSTDYSNATANFDAFKQLSAKLPAGKTSGRIILRYKYYSTNYNRDVIKYSSVRYNINQPVVNPPSGIDPAIITKIQAMGFNTNGIANFSSTHYLVENDVLIKKSSLNISNPMYSINNDKVHNINILLDQSILVHNMWPSAILLAVEVWNSTPNCDVKLNLIYSDSNYNPLPETDILIKGDDGLLASTLVTVAEFPNGDGKSGNSILINTDFKDPSTNSFINSDRAARKVIHAIGHSLGLNHNNSSSSIMNGSTGVVNLEVYPILHNYDVALINALYSINPNSLIVPYIGGASTLNTNGQFTYIMSYLSKESGVYYKWEIVGINGTNYNYEFTDDTDGILSEMAIADAGNYQLKCTISGGKYATPVTATKNITVL
ncbi:hypothetical protein FA048_17985 [Pedobacter polaris]|uniref:Peptidase M10 metallopeptidase domain-containing protein n=1 Tax=Pedobacter polaris TaxID=2571273 RepID=A0A4U1CG40_9SPHI|nr:matrixin family metalloprotease [Pedobacter polaris]TKC05609.1 hypothetical protein FA048_17985 [Pedobacter polaris]